MKTTIKLTAIAVITVLVALACVPEVELTPRDYSDRNEAQSAKYFSSNGHTTFPSFNFSLDNSNALPYFAAGTTVAENRKETIITFPDRVDVLKADDDHIEAALKEFLSFSQYKNLATAPTAGTSAAVWTPSELTTPVDYSFVRRQDTNKVVIKVDVPNIDYIALKIDASKYRCRGQPCDYNRDGKVDIYDDLNSRVRINGTTTETIVSKGSWTNDFFGPIYGPINVNLASVTYGTFTNTTTKPILFQIYNSGYNGTDNAWRRTTYLADILPKIEIQKYDNATNTWAKESDATSFVGGGTVPNGTQQSGITWANDIIYGSISPVDLGIYRLVAKDIANLKTTANIGDSGNSAIIRINTLPYNQNTYYADPVTFFNSEVRQWETATPIQAVSVRHDSNRQNVVLDIFFRPIMDNKATAPGNVYLEAMDIVEFNKNFKLVYNPSDTNAIITGALNEKRVGITSDNNIAELKVVGVIYSASKHFDQNISTAQLNCITVTLDPSYRLSVTSSNDFTPSRSISLLLNTGFKYAGGHVTFGQYNNINQTFYDGSYFWRSYGQVPGYSAVQLKL